MRTLRRTLTTAALLAVVLSACNDRPALKNCGGSFTFDPAGTMQCTERLPGSAQPS